MVSVDPYSFGFWFSQTDSTFRPSLHKYNLYILLHWPDGLKCPIKQEPKLKNVLFIGIGSFVCQDILVWKLHRVSNMSLILHGIFHYGVDSH